MSTAAVYQCCSKMVALEVVKSGVKNYRVGYFQTSKVLDSLNSHLGDGAVPQVVGTHLLSELLF